jgi:DNA-binding response OmpR family regulator
MKQPTAQTRAILCGLEHDVASELRSVLHAQNVSSEVCSDMEQVLNRADRADVVFCPFSQKLMTLMKAITVPVVIVSRHPEVSQWLDALEAGAADYCAAPFETSQLRWILQSNSLVRAAA